MSGISVRLARKPCLILADGSLSPSCRQAPEIVDGLIPSERVALVRAQAFLDANGAPRVPVAGNWAAAENLFPRQLIEVLDSERGPYKAKLKSVTYTLSINDKTVTADAAVRLERLADDLD